MYRFSIWIESEQLFDEAWSDWKKAAIGVGASALMGLGSLTTNAQTAAPQVSQQTKDSNQVIASGNSSVLGEWKLHKLDRGYVVLFSVTKIQHPDNQVMVRKQATAKNVAADIFMRATGSSMQGVSTGLRIREDTAGVWFIPSQP